MHQYSTTPKYIDYQNSARGLGHYGYLRHQKRNPRHQVDHLALHILSLNFSRLCSAIERTEHHGDVLYAEMDRFYRMGCYGHLERNRIRKR